MKVILLSDLRHRGKRGETVEVKPGFARNFLLPQGLALVATPGNQKYFEQQRKKIDQKHAAERDAAARIAGDLVGVTVNIRKRVSESQTLYGSVTAGEIADALKAKGYDIDRRRIDLEGLEFDVRLDDVEALYLDKLMATRDANEGLQAFIEKRQPRWEHR